MECKFQVGQKVVCLEDTIIPKFLLVSPMPTVPIKGTVYTIREILIGEMTGKPCLRFHEIPNEEVTYVSRGQEWAGIPAWEADCFRPVVERKTDISVFKAMLKPSKQRADA